MEEAPKIQEDYSPLLFGAIIPRKHQPMVLAAHWFATNTNLVPLFWGPTATGKTWDIELLAKALGAHYEVILPSTSIPDEVVGFRTYNSVTGSLEDLPPPWFKRSKDYLERNPDGKVVLFFDEVGQARPETRAALYTFLRNRTLNSEKIHEDDARVMVFGATNPAIFSAALKSRCAFIHFPPSQEVLLEIAGEDSIAKFIVEHGTNYISVKDGGDNELDPTPPPAPVTINASSIAALRAIKKSGKSFWVLPNEAHEIILSSILPETLAEKLVRHLTQNNALDATELARHPDLLYEQCKRLPRNKAVPLSFAVLTSFPNLSEMEKMEAIGAIHLAFTDDPEKLFDFFNGEKSPEIAESIKEINPINLEKFLKDKGLVYVENDQLKGKFVENLERHAEVEN
jgi:hypothetical protein